MKTPIFKFLGLAFLMAIWAVDGAAAASPNLLKAKQEAEANGYTFITNHDEVVAKAKKEGKVRVLTSMDPANIKATTAAFTKKYPFIDLYVQEADGSTDSAQRILLEIQSGAAKEWDVIQPAAEFRSDYIPYLWKVDVLGMAKQGVLQIPPPMIDPKYGNIVAFFSYFQVTAYNAKLVPAELLPKTWEDFLRPELKGRKFAADIRPKDVAGLVPVWGLEKTLVFARKLAAQQPIWGRGSRPLVSLIAGEIPMVMGPNFGTVKRAQRKAPAGVLQYVIPEPVPVRFGKAQTILATSKNSHAALLWLEWMASLEAQKITDDHEPLSSSVHVLGGAVEQELRGKKLSVVDWEDYNRMEGWERKIVEAYGFPKADARR